MSYLHCLYLYQDPPNASSVQLHQIETKNINIDLQGEQIDSKKTIEVLIKVIETYQTRMDDLLNVVEMLKDENANLKVQLEKQNVS